MPAGRKRVVENACGFSVDTTPARSVNPHTVVIVLSDAYLIKTLQMRSTGNDPTKVVRTRYRTMLAKVQ